MIPVAGTTGWRKHLRVRIQQALEAGSCSGAPEMAEGMLAWLKGNANPFTAWKAALAARKEGKKAVVIPPSTASTRINETDCSLYVGSLNAALRLDAKRLLASFPPDRNEVVATVDGTEANYWHIHGTESKWIPAQSSRTQYATTPGAENTESQQCHTWLVVLLEWIHRGQCMKYPIHVWLLSPLDRAPKRQLAFTREALRLMGIRPGATIGDAGFDSPAAREAAQDPALNFVHRVSDPVARNRWVTLQDGKQTTIRDLMEAATNEKGLTVHHGQMPRSREAYLYRLKKVECNLGGEWVHLTLQVALDAPGSRKNPKFRLKADLCRAFVAPADFSAESVVRVYALRRRVEDYFEQLPLDEPKPRCKTIQSHIVQQAALFYRIALAHARHAVTQLGLAGTLPYPVSYYTIKQAGQDILTELEPAEATAG